MSEEPSNGPRSPLPPADADREEMEAMYFTPRNYYSRLKETLPERSAGLWHHSVGLAWAVLETGGYFLAYLNPLSYFQSHQKKH
jgi:hypothetical protein